MKKLKPVLLLSTLLFALSLLTPLSAGESLLSQRSPLKQETVSPVNAHLLAEDESVQAGHPFWVGVELQLAEGWDTYWKNPGDAGVPTKVDWKLPVGFHAGTLLWPYPEKFTSESLVGFGYTKRVVFLTEIIPPKNLAAGQDIPLEADVSWLACKESCVPGSAHLTLHLNAKAEVPVKNATLTSLFAEAREKIPQSLSKEEAVSFSLHKENIALNIAPSLGEVAEAFFIPEMQSMIDHGAPQVLQKGDKGYSLNLKKADATTALHHVKGVLLLKEKGGEIKRVIQVDTSVTAHSSHGVLNFKIAMLFAFLGGLILNIMPCVLPVMAVKMLSFVKMANEKRSTMLKHGGLFSLGVLVSFWILSAFLLVLRGAGTGVGWGFQLQEPFFVAILIVILFLLALSLFGVFEMGTSLISLGQKTRSMRSPFVASFFSGVLATLVATPCTGPLMGPALGFAMTLPPVSALLIFTSMGIGMAAPYFLFALCPPLIRFLPKPGNWMIIFKQLMGFLMMATCLWLLWVLAAETSLFALLIVLASLLLVAIGAWIYGRWATPLQSLKTRFIAMGIALLCLFVGGAASFKAVGGTHHAPAIATESVTQGMWQAYSPEKVEQLRKAGTPVFIDFTAKWCLICQANKVALHSSEVQKAFAQKGVVTMTADWTKKDPTITKALEELGRSGVPVYVLYSGNPLEKPYILPQTLTGSVVQGYLNRLGTTVMTHVD